VVQFPPRNIQPTVPYGEGSVKIWEDVSYKLDLVTIRGNLAGNQYIRDVLQPVVVPLTMSIISIELSQLIMHNKIVISLEKRQF
jgi:hypothetical protein